ncbi:MAG: hypothetical protein WCP01_12565 [Methylococcaceae bacterium]
MKATEFDKVKEVFISNSHGAHSRIRSTVEIDGIEAKEVSDSVEPNDPNGTEPEQLTSEQMIDAE